jgi:hypothetical protein
MRWPGIIGLGEMMNYPGVINGSQQMLEEIAATMRAGKTVGGHYASPDLGPAFHAYAAGGPADDHEGTSEADAMARMRQGMRAMIRLGSAWFDIEAQITAITERGLDPRNMILCTDDCHSGTLVHEGHMNRAVRHAIACGCDPLVALQMATINTATHFGLEREIGQIAPADFARHPLRPAVQMVLADAGPSLPPGQSIARTLEETRGRLGAAGTAADAMASTASAVTTFVWPKIIAAGNDRVVTLSRWLPKEGRWSMFTKDTPPVAWKPWPKHPQDEADEAAAMAFWGKADG